VRREFSGGVTYVGLDTGQICTVDINNNSEPAGTLQRTIITPWLGSEETRQTYNSIDVTSSMGPAAGNFQLDWSQDKAVTWRGARQITMPQPGTQRAIGRDFGSGRRPAVSFAVRRRASTVHDRRTFRECFGRYVMVVKFPPPPTLPQQFQQLNRWLIELQSIFEQSGYYRPK